MLPRSHLELPSIFWCRKSRPADHLISAFTPARARPQRLGSSSPGRRGPASALLRPPVSGFLSGLCWTGIIGTISIGTPDSTTRARCRHETFILPSYPHLRRRSMFADDAAREQRPGLLLRELQRPRREFDPFSELPVGIELHRH